MAKILLVEDDKSLREIYGVRLQAEGYEIVSAGDGEEALAMAIKERPDLIVSDVMMPKISGFDMLDILRSTTETKNVKVIMMTALSSEDQRARGEALGADRYLVKSQVGIEDVVRTVHDVLGDGVAPAAAPMFPSATTPVAPASFTPAPPEPLQTAPVAPAAPVMSAPFEMPAAAPVAQPVPAYTPEPLPTPAPAFAPVAEPVQAPTPAPAFEPFPVEQLQPPVIIETPVAPVAVALPTPAPLPTFELPVAVPVPAQAPAPFPTPEVSVAPAPAPAGPTPMPQPIAPFSTASSVLVGERVISPLSDFSAPNTGVLDLSSQMNQALNGNGVPPTPPTV